MFGRISRNTIRAGLSPLNTAAVTKSRERSDWVCERSTRAPQAQPVITTTSTIMPIPPFWRYAAITIISGSAGITRNRLTMKLITSPARPRRYPQLSPISTAMMVESSPATKPTNTETRAP